MEKDRFAVVRTAIVAVPSSSTVETGVSQHTHVYSSSRELTGSGIALKANIIQKHTGLIFRTEKTLCGRIDKPDMSVDYSARRDRELFSNDIPQKTGFHKEYIFKNDYIFTLVILFCVKTNEVYACDRLGLALFLCPQYEIASNSQSTLNTTVVITPYAINEVNIFHILIIEMTYIRRQCNFNFSQAIRAVIYKR